LQLHDPARFIAAIVAAAAPEHVGAASRRRAVVYASARYGQPPRSYDPILKFVVFALVPAVPLFRLNQWIVYGGTFGEYYTYGLQAYLLAFAIYWATLTIYVLLYAGFLRGIAEGVALAAAWVAPSRVARVRPAVERAYRVLYYGGVPVFVIMRLWPW